MQNFIFISPNFPTNYWQFCRELKNDGMNVLGIGDQPYDELDAGSIIWHERVGLAYGDRRIYTMRFCLAAVARDSRALPFLK